MIRVIIINCYNYFTCEIKMGNDIESIKTLFIPT